MGRSGRSNKSAFSPSTLLCCRCYNGREDGVSQDASDPLPRPQGGPEVGGGGAEGVWHRCLVGVGGLIVTVLSMARGGAAAAAAVKHLRRSSLR